MYDYLVNIYGFFAAVFLVAITYYRWSFQYWKRRNVPFLEPSIPFGNIRNPLIRNQPAYIELAEYYKKMKKLGHKHAGMYVVTEPIYLILDPELIKTVLVKDFDYFMNHGIYHNARDDPLSAHLFAVEDNRWRTLRAKLTPTFTSGKMKTMFSTISDCGKIFGKCFEHHWSTKKPLDIKEMGSKFIVDVIGSSGFGIDCNSFENPDSEFVLYGKKAFNDYAVSVRLFMIQYFKDTARKLGFKLISEDVAKFFTNLVGTTVKYRDQNDVRRGDFLQILMDLRGTENELSPNEMAAQVYMFFFAGFESISITTNFLMHELAMHQDIQDRMRAEMEEVIGKHGGEITYDGLKEMTYMGQILEENIRKNGAVPFLFRICTRNYKVPGTDATVDKGTMVLIPSYAFHHDPEYYPDPEKFDPDRFSEENKDKIVPYTFLTFGGGPRGCIATRYAWMVLKIGLVSSLRKYRIRLNPTTPETLTFKKNDLGLTSNESIYLDVEKIGS